MSRSIHRVRREKPGFGVLMVALSCLLAAGGGCGDSATPADSVIGEPSPPTPAPIELCARAPHDQLCSFVPHDVLVSLPNAYQGIAPNLQRPFDQGSWQLFVALNWPATPAGEPLAAPIGSAPGAPRVWESYATVFEVFGGQPDGRSPAPAECEGVGSPQHPVFQAFAKSGNRPEVANFLQATGQPVIDRNLNFVIYDVRMNPVEVDYITSNGLDTAAGQMAFANAGNTVSFPLGFYDDPDDATGGSTGAMEIKAAWRILYPSLGDDPNRFYNIQARVYVPAGESKDGTAFCFEARLGLVGFHVIQRTTDPQDGGARQSWNWATFEHVDNAPLATNAGDPATTDAGPTTCEPPDTDTRYSFYDPACTGCTPNGPPPTPSPGSGYLWESTAPYGREYANPGGFGTQVVRCWRIYDETRELNERFQQAFTGSVWANYRLLNTQWQSSLDIPPFDPISIPTYLGNAVIETYIQSESDCLGCHAFATTTAGQDANFSFLLSYAQ